MNEKISYGLDLYSIEKSLAAGGPGSVFEPYDKLEWLKKSYNDPEEFWTNLLITRNSFFPWAAKSIPFKKYDFYHDIIVCSRPGKMPALRWFDMFSGWKEISYSDLEIQAGQMAYLWKNSGVSPGQTICIIHPLGEKFIISLLAGLKLGLIISHILPQGRSYLEKRLEMLAPDHIASDSIYTSMIVQWKDRILNQSFVFKEISADIDQSYSYRSGDTVFKCFDPSSITPHIPVDINADFSYLCPMRDGIIGLGLRPGNIYAAPGFHFSETQPALVLSGLLTGAAFLHLEQERIFDNPEILTNCPLKAIGINQRIRDFLIQNPIEIGNLWKFWFRNPAESSDMDKWHSFIHRLKLDNVLAGNLKWEPVSGGCSLFSIKHTGMADVNVLPSAGVKWGLADMADTSMEALGEFGVLCLESFDKDSKAKTVLADIITKNRDQWIFTGSNLSGKAGRHYPLEEVLELINNKMPGICCTIVQVPGEPVFDLIIFTGTKDTNEPELIKSIYNIIEKELGREFIPDRIKIFPYYPRCDQNGNTDHHWCQSQYITGGLNKNPKMRFINIYPG